MKKEEAIQKFKELCNNPLFSRQRRVAVETQFNREVWALSHLGMIAKIRRYSEKLNCGCLEMLFAENAYQKNNNYLFGLTSEEYNSLQKEYFGDFIPDVNYLRRIGAISDIDVEALAEKECKNISHKAGFIYGFNKAKEIYGIK